jgi:mono/diheme cytochrome c family protein
MSIVLRVLSTAVIVSCCAWFAQPSPSQEKSEVKTQEKTQEKSPEKTAETPAVPAATKKENPVKSTPEVLAAAKKVFGYDCAMCHGEHGDGKGELVESMKLTLKDWREPAVISGLSDGDIYDLIVKGKDKMVGEGDRLAPAKVWGLVHYVRTFPKKSGT